MIRKIVLAVIVAVLVTIGLALLGGILAALNVEIAAVVGNWLKTYSALLGILAGLWYYFSDGSFRLVP